VGSAASCKATIFNFTKGKSKMKKIVIGGLVLLFSSAFSLSVLAEPEEDHKIFVRGEGGKMVEIRADENSTEVEKDGKVVYSSGEEEQAAKDATAKTAAEKDKK
jgi:hypothetical protein